MYKPDLPHDPYINAVIDALTNVGLEPDDSWTSDAESDPRGDGCERMLDAVLRWNSDHDAVNDDELPDGMLLIWEHSAGGWQSTAVQPDGSNDYPDHTGVGLFADPAHVVTAVRELLAGRAVPWHHDHDWPHATEAEAAVKAWETEDGTR